MCKHHTRYRRSNIQNLQFKYLQRYYNCTKMKEIISNFINSWEIWQPVKYSRKSFYVPIVLTETPSSAFEPLQMDICINNYQIP